LLGLYLPEDFFTAPRKAEQYRVSPKQQIRILSFYIAWGADNSKPDLAGMQNVITQGYIPMITWEPWRRPEASDAIRPDDQPDFSLQSILSGRHDDYIRHWACAVKELSQPVFLRPMHEMNGNWYPWCGTTNGNTPGNYVEAWRYLRAIFREAQNDNALWVWCPYAHSVPDERDNEIACYFPGDREVDWLGLDGYNWGTNRDWASWQSFEEIFAEGYAILTKLAPGKPIMIAEVGCAEEGGDKSAWIRDAFEAVANKLFQTKALVWFNVDKECDWRMESSEKSAASFKNNWSRL